MQETDILVSHAKNLLVKQIPVVSWLIPSPANMYTCSYPR